MYSLHPETIQRTDIYPLISQNRPVANSIHRRAIRSHSCFNTIFPKDMISPNPSASPEDSNLLRTQRVHEILSPFITIPLGDLLPALPASMFHFMRDGVFLST